MDSKRCRFPVDKPGVKNFLGAPGIPEGNSLQIKTIFVGWFCFFGRGNGVPLEGFGDLGPRDFLNSWGPDGLFKKLIYEAPGGF